MSSKMKGFSLSIDQIETLRVLAFLKKCNEVTLVREALEDLFKKHKKTLQDHGWGEKNE